MSDDQNSFICKTTKTRKVIFFMKALILNSGLGSRMGVLTSEHPKCMTEISAKETILADRRGGYYRGCYDNGAV